MDFIAKKTEVLKQKTHCAVVFAFDNELMPSAETLDKAHAGVLKNILDSKDLEVNPGSCAWVAVPAAGDAQPYERVLIVQLGKLTKAKTKIKTLSKKDWAKAVSAAVAKITDSAAKDACFYLDDIVVADEPHSVQSLCEEIAKAASKGVYRYSQTKTKVKAPALNKILVDTHDAPSAKKGLAKGKAVGEGINLARLLGDLPGNICTPSYLGDTAKSLGEKNPKLNVKVLGEKQMAKLKMGSLLSVGNGSEEESKLIVMEFLNGKSSDNPYVLVGKGITFDTGGISIKPGPAMDEMKFDMCGAASVFGALSALMELDAPINVVGIVAAAENMPSSKATKPGDVVTSMSGQTIEILNTDAEGRLVLCDALTYAERYKPKSVVDIATLTGACVIALGNVVSGLFSNNDALAADLFKAGETALDRVWQMPLYEDYQNLLDSNFADMANVGSREAGSVTAACFLSRYTKKYPWAHLDIAGTAWLGGAKKGATGRPVGLLVEYLLSLASDAS